MFGDKFYKYLEELNNWQRSLFSLCLAQRMYPNYILFCETTGDHEAAHVFTDTIEQMWVYHTDKNNHINLEELLFRLEKHIPEPREDGPYGAFPALDACVALSSSINAIIANLGDEAIEACKASVCTVAKFLEMQNDEEYDDDELREMPLMDSEIEYQVELLKQVKQKRDSAHIASIRDELLAVKVSNIGVSLED